MLEKKQNNQATGKPAEQPPACGDDLIEKTEFQFHRRIEVRGKLRIVRVVRRGHFEKAVCEVHALDLVVGRKLRRQHRPDQRSAGPDDAQRSEAGASCTINRIEAKGFVDPGREWQPDRRGADADTLAARIGFAQSRTAIEIDLCRGRRVRLNRYFQSVGETVRCKHAAP